MAILKIATNSLAERSRACDAGLPGNIGIILEAAAPIYRAHWWADHDRTNRRWVVRVSPLVREQGVGLSQRLADIYQSKWPKDKIRVEVCAFANSAGAYTTLDPLRVTIASIDPRNQGPEALEVLFHEASHDIARPVEDAISRECRQRDKPIPRDLWHALIFFTTSRSPPPRHPGRKGKSRRRMMSPPQPHSASTVPPGLREKLTQRGWEEYSRLLVIYWQPYLDGKSSSRMLSPTWSPPSSLSSRLFHFCTLILLHPYASSVFQSYTLPPPFPSNPACLSEPQVCVSLSSATVTPAESHACPNVARPTSSF